jgi:AcrR family transcriptional regulator
MSPKKPEEFELMRAESRGKILQSALTLFANDGYHKTSMEKIAKNANVSKGLIYNYYKSKNDLLHSIIMLGFSHNERLITEIGKETSPKQQLKLLINTIFDLFESQKEFYQLYSSIIMQPLVLENSRDLLDQIYKSIFDTFEMIFTNLQYQNPMIESKILGATIDGVAVHYFFERANYPLVEVRNQLIQKYCEKA